MEKRAPRKSPAPARPRTPRRRTAAPGRRPHTAASRAAHTSNEESAELVEAPAPTTYGGGSSGHGPADDDGYGRGDGGGSGDGPRLLIVLGILALGAGVLSARLLTRTPRRGRS